MIGKPKSLVEFLFNQDRDKIFELKEFKETRSNNANKLFWKMCGLIADNQRLTKDDVHLQMLKDYGQSEIFSVQDHINVTGYFKYFDEIGKGRTQGKDFKHIRVFKESHMMTTYEMSILIDGVIQEASQLGICTVPPEELERIVKAWDKWEWRG